MKRIEFTAHEGYGYKLWVDCENNLADEIGVRLWDGIWDEINGDCQRLIRPLAIYETNRIQ